MWYNIADFFKEEGVPMSVKEKMENFKDELTIFTKETSVKEENRDKFYSDVANFYESECAYYFDLAKKMDPSFTMEKYKKFTPKEKYDFFKFLFLLNEEGQIEEALTWTYQNLLRDLKEQYPVLFTDLSLLNKILSSNFFSTTQYSDLIKEEKIPKVSKKEVLSLTREFLSQFDPCYGLSTRFESLLSQHRIVFFEEDFPMESWVQKLYLKENPRFSYAFKIDYIFAPLTGTLKDVISIVHELIHGYFPIEKTSPVSFLDEFPSIFFESLVCQFLEEKGYSSSQVKSAYRFREESYVNMTLNLLDAISLLQKVERNEKITKEDFIHIYKEEEVRELFPEDFSFVWPFFEENNQTAYRSGFEKMHEHVLELNSFSFMRSFQYMIGKKLTLEIKEKENRSPVEIANQILSLSSLLENSDLSLPYYLSSLGLWELYFSLCPYTKKENVFPCRIEEKEDALGQRKTKVRK